MVVRLALAAWLLFCGPQLDAQQMGEVGPGKPALVLGIERWLEPREGGPRAWDDLRGKVVVLEFWATWCGPCVAAIPHLNELVEKFQNRPVQFISISDEDEAVVKKFLAARPIKGWLALDTDRSVFKGYGVEGIPTTVLVDKSGVIIGLTDPDQITAAVLDDVLAGNVGPVLEKLARRQFTSWEEQIRGTQNAPRPLFEILIRPGAPGNTGMSRSTGKLAARGMKLRIAISVAYGISTTRVVMDDPIGNTRYDFLLTVPKESAALLDQFFQQALESTFKLRVRRETRETDVYVLATYDKHPPALHPSSAGGMTSMSRGKLTGMGISLNELAEMLEGIVERPVVDETRLADKYDVEFTWDEDKPESVIAAVRERLGLELREAKRPIEMLIIETALQTPRPTAEKADVPPK